MDVKDATVAPMYVKLMKLNWSVGVVVVTLITAGVDAMTLLLTHGVISATKIMFNSPIGSH